MDISILDITMIYRHLAKPWLRFLYHCFPWIYRSQWGFFPPHLNIKLLQSSQTPGTGRDKGKGPRGQLECGGNYENLKCDKLLCSSPGGEMMLTGEGRSLCSWEGKRKNSNTPQCVWSTIQGNQFCWKKPKTRRQRDSETPWPHCCTLTAVHPAKKTPKPTRSTNHSNETRASPEEPYFLASFDRIQGKELRYEWNFMENFYKTVFWSRKSPILYNMSLSLLSARCGLTARGDAAVLWRHHT